MYNGCLWVLGTCTGIGTYLSTLPHRLPYLPYEEEMVGYVDGAFLALGVVISAARTLGLLDMANYLLGLQLIIRETLASSRRCHVSR